MEGLQLYTSQDIAALTNDRQGELKLGSCVQLISSIEDLESSSARFVLLGIPEDIGVRANLGVAGTSTAWLPALKALLNVQSNRFLNGSELLVLGQFNFNDPAESGQEAFYNKVAQIDTTVYEVIERIVAADKIPIVIGGGHNNAYPIIKGTSLAFKKPMHVINIDAHADLRPTEGRHSGNGFSYAFKDGFLGRYGIFGLHQNYNNEAVLLKIAADERIYPVFFDEILIGKTDPAPLWEELVSNFEHPGLELDLDSIANVLSSASTPSGFQLNEIRRILLSVKKKYTYLHICEGATALSDGRQCHNTSKTIAYLITDFIKSQL